MLRDYVRRLLRLAAGIAVSSLGIVLMLQANVGLEPWSVLQQGLTLVLPVSYGLATVIAGAAAIGLAVLFGESFGVGTIVNIIGCGVCIDAMLALDWVPQLHSLPAASRCCSPDWSCSRSAHGCICAVRSAQGRAMR